MPESRKRKTSSPAQKAARARRHAKRAQERLARQKGQLTEAELMAQMSSAVLKGFERGQGAVAPTRKRHRLTL
jgi:hypothetical protein